MLALVWLVGGCSKAPTGLGLGAITPNRGLTSQATPTTISGVFRPRIYANYDDPSGSAVSTDFGARLVGNAEVALVDVRFVSPTNSRRRYRWGWRSVATP